MKILKRIFSIKTIFSLILILLLIFISGCSKSKYTLSLKNHRSKKTQAVFEFINDNYGKKILSGQQLSCDGDELKYIYETTGKQPAIAGFDMMNQTQGWNDSAVDDAIAWHKETGGIVSFMWHWFPPNPKTGERHWSFMSDEVDFDIEKALTMGTNEYDYIVRDIRAVGTQLKKLKDNNVPVLWRPLHEAGGVWFWWSAKGEHYYKQLWQLMYDIFMNEMYLQNIIWVWSGYSNDWDWYVGDEYCDIVSMDLYFQKDKKYGITYEYNTGKDAYLNMYKRIGDKKIIGLSEIDQLPNVNKLEEDKVKWSWFMTWHGEFIVGEKYNKNEMLKEVYESDYVLTCDNLPDWGDDSKKGLSSQITKKNEVKNK